MQILILSLFLTTYTWANYPALENKLMLKVKSAKEWEQLEAILPRVKFLYKSCQHQLRSRQEPQSCYALIKLQQTHNMELTQLSLKVLLRHCLVNFNKACRR